MYDTMDDWQVSGKYSQAKELYQDALTLIKLAIRVPVGLYHLYKASGVLEKNLDFVERQDAQRSLLDEFYDSN